jgi:putative transposase
MDNTTTSTVDPPVVTPESDRELAEQLMERARAEGLELTGPNGLLTGLTRRVLETALETELTEHLGYESGDPAGRGSGNSRNGRSTKKVHTEVGPVEIGVPRDRNGTFTPQVVPRHARRLEGFNEAIVSLYARGMTTGDIQGHLRQLYGAEVSRELISKVTDAVVEEMAEWQSRPLDAVYPVLLIDAIFVKIRDGSVANRPIYVAMGINVDGYRDVLGMWVGPTGGEGAKVWMAMLTELRNRGVADVCIVCCDGLKGLPDTIVATWPQATVQTCVVHLVRNSLRYASKADWGQVTKEMKAIYTAPTVEAAEIGAARVLRAVGGQVPGDDRRLGAGLAGVRAVPGVPGRDPQAHLHHQRHRVAQRPVPQGGAPARALPERPGRPQSPLPHHPRTRPGADQPDRQDQRLEIHPQRAHHPLRRQARRPLTTTLLTQSSGQSRRRRLGGPPRGPRGTRRSPGRAPPRSGATCRASPASCRRRGCGRLGRLGWPR